MGNRAILIHGTRLWLLPVAGARAARYDFVLISNLYEKGARQDIKLFAGTRGMLTNRTTARQTC